MPGTCAITVNLHDGSRELIRPSFNPLLTLRDGAQHTHVSKFVKGNAITIPNVPVHDNLDDRYTVLASAKKHKDAGFFPIEVAGNSTHSVSLMLVHKNAALSFRQARWDNLKSSAPELFRLLTAEGATSARQQYEQLLEESPQCLACLLNITRAIEKLPLPAADKPLPLFRRIEIRRVDDARLATGIRQDRFFAYAEKTLIDIIRSHAQNGASPEIFEKADSSLHPGADLSWKENRFSEANLQFTFHTGDARTIDQKDCVKVEMDMDYYRDLGAHFFLEVIPNEASKLTGSRKFTDPAQVYALRWMAAKNSATPEDFDPPYTLEADVA